MPTEDARQLHPGLHVLGAFREKLTVGLLGVGVLVVPTEDPRQLQPNSLILGLEAAGGSELREGDGELLAPRINIGELEVGVHVVGIFLKRLLEVLLGGRGLRRRRRGKRGGFSRRFDPLAQRSDLGIIGMCPLKLVQFAARLRGIFQGCQRADRGLGSFRVARVKRKGRAAFIERRRVVTQSEKDSAQFGVRGSVLRSSRKRVAVLLSGLRVLLLPTQDSGELQGTFRPVRVGADPVAELRLRFREVLVPAQHSRQEKLRLRILGMVGEVLPVVIDGFRIMALSFVLLRPLEGRKRGISARGGGRAAARSAS